MFPRACVIAVLALSASFVIPYVARATDVTPSPPPSPLKQIGEVTVTSDRLPEPLSSTTRPTFIVTRAQMDAFGARTVADAIAHVPGI